MYTKYVYLPYICQQRKSAKMSNNDDNINDIDPETTLAQC